MNGREKMTRREALKKLAAGAAGVAIVSVASAPLFSVVNTKDSATPTGGWDDGYDYYYYDYYYYDYADYYYDEYDYYDYYYSDYYYYDYYYYDA